MFNVYDLSRALTQSCRHPRITRFSLPAMSKKIWLISFRTFSCPKTYPSTLPIPASTMLPWRPRADRRCTSLFRFPTPALTLTGAGTSRPSGTKYSACSSSATEFRDVRTHIRCETVITPQNWERDFNIFYGAPFSLAHSLGQMLCFRPRNKFDEIESCFLVGGGTSPGSGLPTIYESARISTNSMLKQFNMTPYPVRPLPR